MTTPHWDFLTGDPDKDRRNVGILLDSVEALYGSQRLNELMSNAVDRAIQVTGAKRGLLLLEGEGGELVTAVARSNEREDLPLDEVYSKSVVGRVWDTGEPASITNVENEELVALGGSVHGMQLLSIMAVPMPVKGRSLGVLYVDSTVVAKKFSQSDLAVFKALGGLVGMAVENARLLAEKEEQDRLKGELLVAQNLQKRLIPVDLPQPDGFDLAGLFRPCDETSGDYYDVIPFGERFALVMGDVSNHGLGPAMHMAMAHALVHAALRIQPEPHEVVRSVNVVLEASMADNEFMSMFIGVLDPERRTLRYASAGHCPPLLLHPDATIEELPRTGMVLGIDAESSYRLSEPRVLEPGSVVLLFTDGIYEARDASGEMFGEDRLRDSYVRHAAAGDADAIINGVIGDLGAFIGEAPLDDDLTCLVVRAL